MSGRTEETLAAALLDDLDDTGLQLLDRRDVVGEDTHLTRLGGDVDLDGILGLIDGLDGCGNKQSARENVALVGHGRSRIPSRGPQPHHRPGIDVFGAPYLVGKRQAELDLLENVRGAIHSRAQYAGGAHLVRDGLGITSALEGSADGGGARPKSRTSNAEGVHGGCGLNCSAERRRGHCRSSSEQIWLRTQIRLAGIVRIA